MVEDNSIVHWTELQGNPLRFSLDPRMLEADGYKVKMSAKLKGKSKKDPYPVTVIFDRSYVLQFIASKILETLKPQKYNELQALISDAYKIYKN